MWIFIVIVIVGFILYSFFKDRDHMLERQVDMHGGMAKKYELLVQLLTDYPGANVAKVTRDHIHIRAVGQTTVTNFFIMENFNKVVIEWVGQFGTLGDHKNKWEFPHNYPQEKMVEEISEYMQWKTQQMYGL